MTKIKTDDKLYKHTGNADHEMLYKQYRNKLTKMIFEAGKEHCETLLNGNKNNLKKSCCILMDLINKKKVSISCSKFTVNGETTTDKMEITNGFNKYLLTLAQLWQETTHRIISHLRHSWKTSIERFS